MTEIIYHTLVSRIVFKEPVKTSQPTLKFSTAVFIFFENKLSTAL